MQLPRRRFLHLAAGAAALPTFSPIARAQSYPTRPVRLIVGFAAGGGPDITARLIGQSLSERLGQPVVIENRPGAGSNIGTEAAVRAAPDGYTLLYVNTGSTIGAALYKNLNFDITRDIAPVAGFLRSPSVMEVNPSFPAKTVPEFIAYAKANPGKVNLASGGTGTGQHLIGELFKMMAGVELVHVPYRGTPPALIGLLAGEVHVIFDNVLSTIEYIKAGKVRALAVTTATRSELLPEMPTVGDFLPGFEASTWGGIGVPKSTPIEIADTLNKEINKALADSKMKARIADLGSVPMPMTPGDFGKLIADETEKWGKVIRAAGIKPE
jgi:tripartite-type tricarboxylate transporter receptor subunit TctC